MSEGNEGKKKVTIRAINFGYVKSHRDTACGRGETVFTDDPDDALQFDDSGAAFVFYRQQSKTVPLREDGRPNRPLTAFTVEIAPVP
jgi:hypothetical protein